jgi:hypothetical protein
VLSATDKSNSPDYPLICFNSAKKKIKERPFSAIDKNIRSGNQIQLRHDFFLVNYKSISSIPELLLIWAHYKIVLSDTYQNKYRGRVEGHNRSITAYCNRFSRF